MPEEGAAGGLRFALLRHAVGLDFAAESGRGSHFDLLLQSHAFTSTEERALLAWSLHANPFSTTGNNRCSDLIAEKLPDHRARYLTYEGAIDGDRGTVWRVAEGDLVWQHSSRTEYQAALQGACFTGNASLKIRGRLCLQCSENGEWRTTFLNTARG